jgi:hypothetical protein
MRVLESVRARNTVCYVVLRIRDSRSSTVGYFIDDNVNTPVTGYTDFGGKVSEINTDYALEG